MSPGAALRRFRPGWIKARSARPDRPSRWRRGWSPGRSGRGRRPGRGGSPAGHPAEVPALTVTLARVNGRRFSIRRVVLPVDRRATLAVTNAEPTAWSSARASDGAVEGRGGRGLLEARPGRAVDQSSASPSPVGRLDDDPASGLARLARREGDAQVERRGRRLRGLARRRSRRTGRPRTRRPSIAAASRLASLASAPSPSTVTKTRASDR